MNPGWKRYFLYTGLIIAGSVLLFLFVSTVVLKNTGFKGKTLWDWMELLIIPLVLAGGAFYLNRSERNTEREIATDRQQEAALQAYLDRMADLLLRENLRMTESLEVRRVARTRSLSVLRGLDPPRKEIVLRFLYEAHVIGEYEERVIPVDLENADFFSVNLQGVDLDYVYLPYVDLRKSNISKASFTKANIIGSNLTAAIARGTYFNDCNLRLVNFTDADLSNAQFQGALLGDANFTGATVTFEQLAQAGELDGVIMPDGTVHG